MLMGYHADFDFDLTIPAEHVAKAELALYHSLSECRHESPRDCLGDCFDFEVIDGTFCAKFDDEWGEALTEEEEISPLEALASGVTRGAIHITGWAGKKWGSWEEPLLDALAPFIENGGTVTVKGEDSDTPSEWYFDGNARHERHYGLILHDEENALLAKARRLEETEAILREILHSDDMNRLRSKIESYFEQQSKD